MAEPNGPCPGHGDLLSDLQETLDFFEKEIEELDEQRDRTFAELQDEIRRYRGVLRGVLFALASAIDAKDEYTHGHSRRVAAIAVRVGHEMGLSRRELEELEFGALLHDVGKIGMPEAILNKPGRLTAEEYEIVKQHPKRGSEILRNIPDLDEVDRIARHHHERFDGGGYPDGLHGHETMLGARIVAVADMFDAMTSTRSYREARDPRIALETMKEVAGTQLDPGVVEVFSRLTEAGELDAILRNDFRGAGIYIGNLSPAR
jgi:putative nucleotidyltransferase with HDIG domain